MAWATEPPTQYLPGSGQPRALRAAPLPAVTPRVPAGTMKPGPKYCVAGRMCSENPALGCCSGTLESSSKQQGQLGPWQQAQCTRGHTWRTGLFGPGAQSVGRAARRHSEGGARHRLRWALRTLGVEARPAGLVTGTGFRTDQGLPGVLLWQPASLSAVFRGDYHPGL